jgi:WD40 repeat protein
LQGHSGPLTSIAFSPNGRFLASGGADQVVKVWNIASKSEQHSFRGHSDWVTSVAFAKDGRAIVSASVDHSVLLWRFVEDEATHVGHTRQVTAVAVSNDGKMIASASEDRTVRLWNSATGIESHILVGHAGKITALAIAPDGRHIATAAQDRKIKIWDSGNGREVLNHDSAEEVLLLAYSTDGQKLFAWQRHQGRSDDESADGVRIFDAATLKPLDELIDRGRRVSCLALSADDTMAAMGSADGSVRLWDLTKKERIGGDRPMHAKAVWDLAITPDKKWLIAAEKDGEVKIAPLDRAGDSRKLHVSGAYLDGLLLSPDGRRLATFGDRQIELWDLESLKPLRSWTVGGVRSIAFTQDNKQLIAGLDDSTIYLLDLP